MKQITKYKKSPGKSISAIGGRIYLGLLHGRNATCIYEEIFNKRNSLNQGRKLLKIKNFTK